MRRFNVQLHVMWVAIVVIILMCLCPPWSLHDSEYPDYTYTTKIKYAWIWAKPPKARHCPYVNCTGSKFETKLLIVQCLVVALLAGGVIVTIRAKRPDA